MYMNVGVFFSSYTVGMVFRKLPNMDSVRQVVCDSILMLCQNTLEFEQEVSIEGLLGITLDNKDVVLISIKEHMPQAAPAADHARPPQSIGPVTKGKPRAKRGRSRPGPPRKSARTSSGSSALNDLLSAEPNLNDEGLMVEDGEMLMESLNDLDMYSCLSENSSLALDCCADPLNMNLEEAERKFDLDSLDSTGLETHSPIKLKLKKVCWFS